MILKHKKTSYNKIILICLTFLFFSCEKTFDESEITIIEGLAYLKKDVSLITGKVKLYDNDKIKSEVNYKVGKKNGYERSWYDNGQMSFEANYENGQIVSEKSWFKNGNLQHSENYRNNQKMGYNRWWHDNGQMSFEAYYEGGKTVGIAHRWYSNGQTKYEGNYKDGKEHGVHSIYGKDGTLIGEITFMNGSKIKSTFNLESFKNEIIYSLSVNKTKEYKIENYTFDVIWDNRLSHSENIGYYGGIKLMTIKKDSEILNEITDIEDNIALGEINFKFYDYNFDGHIDFTIPLDCGKICWEKYYLFNPELNKFEHKEEWDYLEIRQIDKINKWIQSESDGNATTDNSKLYKVKGLELIEIETD